MKSDFIKRIYGTAGEIKKMFINYPILDYIFFGILITIITDVLISFISPSLAIIIALFVVSPMIYLAYKKIKDREKIKDVSSEEMKNKYKGLVVFASNIGRTDEEKEENKKRIEKLINELNLENENIRKSQLEELFKKNGIGHILRAIWHHKSKMQYCRVLYTKESENCKCLIEKFIKKLNLSIMPNKIGLIVDEPYNVNALWKIFDDQIRSDLNRFSLKEEEVVYDITTGPSTLSCAMVLKCQPPAGGKLEYTTQKDPKKLTEIEIKKEI